MNNITHAGIRRLAAGWAVFMIGLAPLLWLHTFHDRVAHQAIGPLFLVLWIVLLVCVWEGCKMITPRRRMVWFSVHVAASVLVCVLFFQHLINESL